MLRSQRWLHGVKMSYLCGTVPVFWERNRNIRDVELNRFTIAQCSTTDSKCECKTWNHSRALQLLLTRLFPQSLCMFWWQKVFPIDLYPCPRWYQSYPAIAPKLPYHKISGLKSECWTEYDRIWQNWQTGGLSPRFGTVPVIKFANQKG